MVNSYSYLLSLPLPDHSPARTLVDGADSYVVMAANEADAIAMVVALSGNRAFKTATVTPLEGSSDMFGWGMHCVVFDTNGHIVIDQTVTDSSTTADAAATGSYTYSSTSGANGDTITINGVVISFVTSGAVPALNQLNVTGVPATDAIATAALINNNPEAFQVTAVQDGSTAGKVDLTAVMTGVDGNSITTAKSGTNIAVAGSALTGGTSANKLSSLATALATALNATGVVAHAAFSTPTLTIAGTADAIGNYTFLLEVIPPNKDYLSPTGVSAYRGPGIPGFIEATAQGGSSSAALTATLEGDTYPVPNFISKGRSEGF